MVSFLMACSHTQVGEKNNMATDGRRTKTFQRRVEWDLSKATHVFFYLRGDGAAGTVQLDMTDSQGLTLRYGPEGSNKDFVTCAPTWRKLTIDLVSDKPEEARDENFRIHQVRCLRWTIRTQGSTRIRLGEFGFDDQTSINDLWEKRKDFLPDPHEVQADVLSKQLPDSSVRETVRAMLKELRENSETQPDQGFIRVASDNWTFEDSATGEPFVPFGCNYYGVIVWQPRLFEMFRPSAIDEDFRKMKQLGLNTVRIAFTHWLKCDENDPSRIDEFDLEKFDLMIELARKHGLRLIPVGLGRPWPESLRGLDNYADEQKIVLMEKRWRQFAERYKDEPTIFAWNLANEPVIGWSSEAMKARWGVWLKGKYQILEDLKESWGGMAEQESSWENVGIPEDVARNRDQRLYDYQVFRESVATEWVRRLSETIRCVDGNHLITCGLIQWQFPGVRPEKPSYYAAFNPRCLAPSLDYMSPHFYPLYTSRIFQSTDNFMTDFYYLRAVLRYSHVGKPVVLEEFGWFGGGELRDYGASPGTGYLEQNDQRRWCRAAVEGTMDSASGWLNWPFQDTPASSDCSNYSGLIDSERNIKEWGRDFREIIQSTRPESLKRTRATRKHRMDRREILTLEKKQGEWFAGSLFNLYLDDQRQGGRMNVEITESK